MPKIKLSAPAFILAFAAVAILPACASSPYRPVIDAPPSAKLDADLAHCQSLAAQYQSDDGSIRNRALTGAGVGAIAGGIEDAWDGALVGALLGGTVGAATGSIDQADMSNHYKRDIVRNCMSGRGHRVLG